jgi:NAD(P)-dependent dehydrogenase (short-subunit alcohol dehydrogenase family)
VLVLKGNVCANGEAQRIVGEVVDRFGRLDVLVNHGAGGRIVGTILDLTRESFNTAVEGDVWSVIALSQAAIPVIAQNGGGSIVNITSIGRLGLKERPLRATDAGAVSTLTISMALDHGAEGIRVNGLLLGPTQTSEPPEDPEERQALLNRFRGHAPMGTLHTAEDVAAAALFLASDESRRITGALLPVDAGRSLPQF